MNFTKTEDDMMQPITICLASDNNYAQHGAVVIESILANHHTQTPIAFHYLDGGVSEENKNKLQQVVDKYDHVQLTFHTMGTAYQEFSIDRHISHAAYYRLKIDQILSHSDKAIYLDTDIIVFDDIEYLWTTDLKEYALAAVEDIGLQRKIAEIKNRLDIPHSATYINSGVLIMNLTIWRKKQIGKTILDYLTTHPNLPYHDQDALNAVLWNNTLLLHPRWNTYKGIFHYYYKQNRPAFLTSPFIEAAKSPAIVHFTGSVKPWHYACGMPYADDYYVHLAKTSFKGYTPTDKNINSFLKRWEWKLKRILFKP